MTTKSVNNNKQLDITSARRLRGGIKSGVRAGAQTVHLKLKINGNDAPGESSIASL